MNDPKRVLVVVLGLIVLSLGAYGVKGHVESEGYKTQVNYTTAIQSTKQDDFNYIIDSQQGRVLANGTFEAKTPNLAKFDEMNKGFTHVKRVKQHYTMHQYESCSGKPSVCTTHTYWSWDDRESEERNADKITFMGRQYPASLFNYEVFTKVTDACAFTAPDKQTGLAAAFTKKDCSDGKFYIDTDDRYVYSVAPVSFSATFLATTYGGLKPFNESAITLQDKSINQVLTDVGKYQLYAFWVFIFLIIIFSIGAIYGAYQWVMADGYWSTEE